MWREGKITTFFPLRKKSRRRVSFRKRDHVTV
jgi:hypothetical protein